MTAPSPTPDRPTLLRALVGIVVFGVLGWSLFEIAAVLLFSAATAAGGSIETWAKDPATGQVFLAGIALSAGFIPANLFIGRRLLGLTPEDLRWKGVRSPGFNALWAFLAGAGLIGIVMVLGALAGARWTPDDGSVLDYAGRVGFVLLMLAPAALAEELMFRGLPLIALDRTVGRGMAIGVTALLFSLAHAPNTGVTTLSIGNICVAGILLGVLLFAPGGLWTATGLHLGWNWALTALDAPVSGTDFKIPLIDYLPGRPEWLTGGAFGPEGGVMASLVLALATILAARWFLAPHHPVERTDQPG